MGDLRKRLSSEITRLRFDKWGIGDIAGLHPLAEKFPKALSVAVSFRPAFAQYDEAIYFKQSAEVRDDTEARVEQLVDFFVRNGIPHTTIPGALLNPQTWHAHFPHKLAATRAGLGWIGRSDLLVTREFGPRVRLGTILFDAEVTTDAPVTRSNCGACHACTTACPAEAVLDDLWRPGAAREELLSVPQCNGYRDYTVGTLGRKHSCGLCVLVCPQGTGGMAGA